MKPFKQSAEESNRWQARLPIGSIVVHTTTERKWKISDHLFGIAGVALLEYPTVTVGYLSPDELQPVSGNERKCCVSCGINQVALKQTIPALKTA